MVTENQYNKAKKNERAVEAQAKMERLLNSFGDENMDAFITLMEIEHNTIQNSFSKLCFKWIEHIAGESHSTDLRNKSSQDVARQLLDAFKAKMAETYTDSTLELMSKPSGYCHMI